MRQVLSAPAVNKRVIEVTQEEIKELKKSSLFVGLPAKVVSVDKYETEQVVTVQTMHNMEYDDGRILPVQTLRDVFVSLPNSGGFSIKSPVAIGDLCTLHYSHKSLSNYLVTDGTSPLTQSRNFIAGPNDCWCELNGGTRRNNTSPSISNFIIEGPETKITITPEGDFSKETSGNLNIEVGGNTTVNIIGDVTLNVGGTTSVASTGNMEISAPSMTFDTPTATFTGDVIGTSVSASSSLKINGVEVGGHLHGGVTSGGSNTAPLA